MPALRLLGGGVYINRHEQGDAIDVMASDGYLIKQPARNRADGDQTPWALTSDGRRLQRRTQIP